MAEKQVTRERKHIDDNVIYIGGKPFNNYVWALLTQISANKNPEINIIARGKYISRAVDVVEVAKSKFLNQGSELTVKTIEISSEKFNKKEEDGKERPIKVSVIKIVIAKSK